MIPRSFVGAPAPVAAKNITGSDYGPCHRPHSDPLGGFRTAAVLSLAVPAVRVGWHAFPFAREYRRLVTRPGPRRQLSEANVSTQQSQAGQAPRLPSPDVDASRPSHHQGPPAQRPAPAVGLIWR